MPLAPRKAEGQDACRSQNKTGVFSFALPSLLESDATPLHSPNSYGEI